jgi:hypothetical protein
LLFGVIVQRLPTTHSRQAFGASNEDVAHPFVVGPPPLVVKASVVVLSQLLDLLFSSVSSLLWSCTGTYNGTTYVLVSPPPYGLRGKHFTSQ